MNGSSFGYFSSGISRLLVHAEVFPVPRNALDASRVSTLLLGLWRMYCMQLGDFRGNCVYSNIIS